MTEKFCPNCEEYRQVREEDRNETYKVRGKDISLPVHVEVCTTCGETIYDKARDSDLMHRIYDEYRRLENLLTPEDIKATRKRYRLSQQSLADLLGMSEATVNRYEQGGLQDPAHDALIRACQNPETVRQQLQRRGHLLTAWQRQRVEESLTSQVQDAETLLDRLGEVDWICMPRDVSIYTGNRRFEYRRFAAVTVWFCRRLNAVSRTVINKLMFYADFLGFKTSTVSLTGAAYRRLVYGPVPADYGGLLSRMESEEVLASQEVEYANGYSGTDYSVGPNADALAVELDPREAAVLEFIAETFRNWSAKRISEESHREAAWRDTPDKALISYETAKDLSLSLPV